MPTNQPQWNPYLSETFAPPPAINPMYVPPTAAISSSHTSVTLPTGEIRNISPSNVVMLHEDLQHHNKVQSKSDPDEAMKAFLEDGGFTVRTAHRAGKYLGGFASSHLLPKADDPAATDPNSWVPIVRTVGAAAVATGAQALNALNEARNVVIVGGGKELEGAARASGIPLAGFATRRVVSMANGAVNGLVGTQAAFAMGAASSAFSPTTNSHPYESMR